MKRARILTIAGVVLALCFVFSMAKPNFSGNWKVNAAKSDFGPMPAPAKMEQKIAHNDPDLKVTMVWGGDQGEMTIDNSYTTDGKECVNTSQMGESKSTLSWEGDTLVIVTKMSIQGADITMTNKWTLSEDGASLTVNSHFAGPQGEGDMKMVMEKQ